MTETERLKKLKAALETAAVKMVEAESFLEEAAGLAEPEDSDKDVLIWDLKSRLDRLGVEILELSKT